MGRQVIGDPYELILREVGEFVVELGRVNLELCVKKGSFAEMDSNWARSYVLLA